MKESFKGLVSKNGNLRKSIDYRKSSNIKGKTILERFKLIIELKNGTINQHYSVEWQINRNIRAHLNVMNHIIGTLGTKKKIFIPINRTTRREESYGDNYSSEYIDNFNEMLMLCYQISYNDYNSWINFSPFPGIDVNYSDVALAIEFTWRWLDVIMNIHSKYPYYILFRFLDAIERLNKVYTINNPDWWCEEEEDAEIVPFDVNNLFKQEWYFKDCLMESCMNNSYGCRMKDEDQNFLKDWIDRIIAIERVLLHLYEC